MGLFSKEEKKPEPVALLQAVPEKKFVKSDKDPIESVLAKEMVIKGEVSFKGKARFDGTIEGNISGEYLILSETAKVTGNIEVATLICHGKVEGNITAEIVTTHATASIHGILRSENLTVESGAALDGEIHASSRKQASPERSNKALITSLPVV
ncbi:polymer-forming cytoskeletal protein [Desulfobulbus sp. F4]|nr:polymer-forming cytoskeletal protein [Desulfobulbus sp. F3]MCW5201249.1 polymer-forming cytoskeletal protein [Desulfobulbus sp. F4]